jgi:hypothetical protein
VRPTQCSSFFCTVEGGRDRRDGARGQRGSAEEQSVARQPPDFALAAADQPVERCQAAFYIGEWDLLRNNSGPAAAALRASSENCPKTRPEYDGAIAELKRLNR